MTNFTLEDALRLGIEAHKAGKVQEADQYYTAILQSQPTHPDANHNMGVLAVSVGKVDQALPFFKKALEANSTVEQFWISYIDALIKAQKTDEAKAALAQAKDAGLKNEAINHALHELKQKHFENNFPDKKGTMQFDQGKFENLYKNGKYQQLISEVNDLHGKGYTSHALYNYLGVAYAALRDHDRAILNYKKSINLNPCFAECYNNIAVTYKNISEFNKAIKYFDKSISLKADYHVAMLNKANCFEVMGDLTKAIEIYKEILKQNPNFNEALKNIGLLIQRVEFLAYNPDIYEILEKLINSGNYVRPKDIAHSITSLLKNDPTIKTLISTNQKREQPELRKIIQELSSFRLLLTLMAVCPIPDITLEKLLTNLRASLLSSISSFNSSREVLDFQSALALQCFTNDYIYRLSEEEEIELEKLEDSLKNTLYKGKQPTPQEILCLGSYKALIEYEWVDQILITKDIEEVFIRQVQEPQTEKELKKNIPRLAKIKDKVSTSVMEQYEENPYPRWFNLAFPPNPSSISKVVNDLRLRLISSHIMSVGSPEILVAGCGTGQHSIQTAKRFNDSKILAIDLSLASLAYAQRKTDELGIKNIRYMQADILDLKKLDKQFDIIESSGVLHHMKNPMTGWGTLKECLKPGGLIKIGLYSELARTEVRKLRTLLDKNKFKPKADFIKNFREELIESEDKSLKSIFNWGDMYNLSEIRDLLFHTQEHQYTIPKLKKCITSLDMTFCGFEHVTLVKKFCDLYPDANSMYDLNKWHEFEIKNPRIFSGMYQFWCQKLE
ncbi:MAG: hypothetical protein CMO97_01675 [Woeseia sp.]|nr:hypothetical protein [Woeseia sp.]